MSMSLVAFRPVGFLEDCEQYEQSSEHPPVLRGDVQHCKELSEAHHYSLDVEQRAELYL